MERPDHPAATNAETGGADAEPRGATAEPGGADAAGGGRSDGTTGGGEDRHRVLSWLDEDDPPPPEEPPPAFPPYPAPLFEQPPYVEPPYAEPPDGKRPYSEPPDSEPPDGGAVGAVGRGRSRRLFTRTAVVVAVAVLTTAIIAVMYVTELGPWGRVPGDDGRDRVAAAPRDGLGRADLDLVTGTASVTVRGGGTGDDLYRITTPEGGRAVPEVIREGDRFTLRLVPNGRDGPDTVDIRLSDAVSWRLRLAGGAAVRRVDATGLPLLRGLEIEGGSTRTELDLPEPTGTVPIRLAGGVDKLSVRLPTGAGARLLVGAGAGRVTIDGRIREGVAAGRVLGTLGWEKSKLRYEIELTTGASTVTVGRRDR